MADVRVVGYWALFWALVAYFWWSFAYF